MSVWFTLNPWRPGNKQSNKSVNKNACESEKDVKKIKQSGVIVREQVGVTAFSLSRESGKVSQGHGIWAKAWMMAGVSQVEMKGDGVSRCKGPEVRTSVMSSRFCEKATWLQWVSENRERWV